MVVKVAVVNSGVVYQESTIQKLGLDSVYIYELGTADLAKFDMLIVPRGSDQEYLCSVRHKLRRFLDSGRVIAAFGELSTPWLPNAEWRAPLEDDNDEPVIVSDHEIFRGLAPSQLRWHTSITTWCCHGHFSTRSEQEVIAASPSGNPIVYIDESSTGGAILCSSNLDPFCHFFQGIPAAERYIRNIIAWGSNWVARRKSQDCSIPLVAAIFSGSGIQLEAIEHLRRSRRVDILPTFENIGALIRGYDVALLLREGNQVAVQNAHDGLVSLLARGGCVLSLGEVYRPWLEELAWINVSADSKDWQIVDSTHPMIQGRDLRAPPWHAHGAFRAREEIEPLIVTGDGAVVLGLVSPKMGGRVVATTLDPDVHLGYGTPSAHALLDSVVDFAVSLAETTWRETGHAASRAQAGTKDRDS